MDCKKVGNMILGIRKEKGLTQKQLADLMNISDKTISKWERGLGCPDVSLLCELSLILGINIEKILSGDLDPNETDGGNMKKIKFYVCSNCGNVLTASGDAEIACCGRKLLPLIAKECDDKHQIKTEKIEDDYYITFSHDMNKQHYVSFVAYVSYDRFLFVKLYPEQGGEVRFPIMNEGTIFFYCTEHGLFRTKP